MSLAPGEQRALAGIEKALRESDPRLAAMLTAFTPPLCLRLRIRGTRLARPRVRWAAAVIVALAATCVSLLGWLLPARRGQPACPAVRQVMACQLVAGRASWPGDPAPGRHRPPVSTHGSPPLLSGSRG